MITLHHYLILAMLLFCIGVFWVVTRRNALIIFMSIELMLNAVNLVFIAFAKHLGSADGHAIVFFVLTVAAAEAAVGLGVIVVLFRNQQTVYVDEINLLKG